MTKIPYDGANGV